jgi:glycine dehydrogenase
MITDSFSSRHIGPNAEETAKMLDAIGVSSLDELISQTVPSQIRLEKELDLPQALSEYDYLNHVGELGKKNKVFKSFIGQGYHSTIVPSVIKRNVLENPGWYTAYTPYQAEIAQGRLEALLNFQTLVMELTGMEIANASLLDEATAAAEAMIMLFHSRPKEKNNANVFFVSELCFEQTIDVLKTRSAPLGIELLIGNHETVTFNDQIFGALVQYPASNGEVFNYTEFAASAKSHGIRLAVAADILSLVLLAPPAEWGADVVVGNSQRFGVPMGFGGPHAAFFTTKEEFKRFIPGRIIGVSVDSNGNRALRMALQTREQHIRRDKATSNICTAQALLAIMASMYGVYHGPDGLKRIATKVNSATTLLKSGLTKLGVSIQNKAYFDTLSLVGENVSQVKQAAVQAGINFFYAPDGSIRISLNETTSAQDLNDIVGLFAKLKGSNADSIAVIDVQEPSVSEALVRKGSILKQQVFNSHHSESEMMRYIKMLENKDLSLTFSMISLGSCTMKLNAASELYPISDPNFANLHPFAPADQTLGYQEMIGNLEKYLCQVTGFAGMSFQPNSGAQGEYAGLMVIRAYHLNRGDAHRTIALIPQSAHGTNPATAVMAGMQVVVVRCDESGNIDVSDLKLKAEQHKDNLACLMVTYPSTHGVFEEAITEITQIIHTYGGQVYMDGANMNAQVGLTSPGRIGADVCHLNLHKTFAIPHGGGGPGVGPIGVAAHLTPFLPGHSLIKTGGEKAITSVSAAPYGSALILLISYGYIRMLGKEGVVNSTKYAILNANYMKAKFEKYFPILYQGKNGKVAHEMILDCREFKRTCGIEVEDIAKRLMDYGYHAPTVSFPVAGTLMVEPTESESLHELDKFCDSLIHIRKEIEEIENGKADKLDNVLKHAPHTAGVVISGDWTRSYSREKAVYPADWIRENKFWPSVGRVDNAYGDRNLVCSCEPMESYMELSEV